MVQRKLNLKEIIEMAIQIKTAGAAFYRKMQEMAKTDETRELFSDLEQAGYRHIKDFEAILSRAISRHHQHEYPATEEDLLYLRAFASRRVFTSPEDAVSRAESLSDVMEAIDMALDFELKSVAFYSGIAELVEDPSDGASVAELENREKVHIASLYKMKEKLAGNKQ